MSDPAAPLGDAPISDARPTGPAPAAQNLTEALTDICDQHNVFGAAGLSIRGVEFVDLLVAEAQRWAARDLAMKDAALAMAESVIKELQPNAPGILEFESTLSKLAVAEREKDAMQEALLESERRRSEMHGFTAVELFDEAKRAQGEAHEAKSALAAAEQVIETVIATADEYMDAESELCAARNKWTGQRVVDAHKHMTACKAALVRAIDQASRP